MCPAYLCGYWQNFFYNQFSSFWAPAQPWGTSELVQRFSQPWEPTQPLISGFSSQNLCKPEHGPPRCPRNTVVAGSKAAPSLSMTLSLVDQAPRESQIAFSHWRAGTILSFDVNLALTRSDIGKPVLLFPPVITAPALSSAGWALHKNTRLTLPTSSWRL